MYQGLKEKFNGFKLTIIMDDAIIYESEFEPIYLWIDRMNKKSSFKLLYGYLAGLDEQKNPNEISENIQQILRDILETRKDFPFKCEFLTDAHIPLIRIIFPSKNLQKDLNDIISFANNFERTMRKVGLIHLDRLSLLEWFSCLYEEPHSLIIKNLREKKSSIKNTELEWVHSLLNELK
jgi:hypothetical protein